MLKPIPEGQSCLDNSAKTKNQICPIVAGKMKSGMRVVDADGREYEAFSARFAYLEVFPIGPNGKPEVFAGNSVFFHLDPATQSMYPGRKHIPVFLA